MPENESAQHGLDVEVAADGALWYIARAGIGGGSVEDNTSTTNGSLWRVRWTNGGLPTKLAITQQPTTVNAGATMAPAVRVAVQDSGSNTVTSSSATVVVTTQCSMTRVLDVLTA